MTADLQQAARWAGLSGEGALAGLGPLLAAGVLEPVDLHVVATLAARFGESDPEVLLAAALAVRAPRYGHVCVDLRALDARSLLPESTGAPVADGAAEALGLPAERDGWAARVARSPLVRPAGPGDTPLVLRGALLYTDRYFAYEDRLHAALTKRFASLRAVADPGLLERGLDALFGGDGAPNRQRRAAEVALQRGAAVISGGPGTGKTWTVRNVLTLLYAQWAAAPHAGSRPRIALAAPTGKAAARVVASIHEGLEDHLANVGAALPGGIDGLRSFLQETAPSTLHRLLGWRPDDPTRFRHDAARPLALDVVIVDEASMVDLALMAKLVDAVPEEARLVLLGDRHQLASVEAGSVLADICGEGDGGPAVVFLTESRRFDADSGIGRFARAAVEDRVEDAIAALPPWGRDEPGALVVADGKAVGRDLGRLAHDPRGGLPKAARRLLVEGYRPYLERLRAGPLGAEGLEAVHADALRRLDGFRALCAHRAGVFGVEGINRAATELLADAGLIRPSGAWWLGRPVLVTQNDYGVRRFNGDVGIVVHDGHGEPVVAFPGDAGGVSYLATVRLPAHETVFAMTIHKSQGSEFTDVLVVLPERRSPVLTKELVYTGVTRAKMRVTVLSDEGVLREALERRVQRASGLGEVSWT